MHKPKELLQVHPFILFWLGLLTGAVLVSLIFFYKMLTPTEYASSSFKWNVKPTQIQTQEQFKEELKSYYSHGKYIEAVMGMSPDFKLDPELIDKSMNPDFNTTDVKKSMNPDF